MRRSAKTLRPAVLAGFVAALLAAQALGAPREGTGASAPLSGVLRADGVPLAGVSLVVRGLTGAAASVVRILKTDAEGTFCLADATPGVYSVLAAVPGFRSASAQVLHRTTADSLSFVRLDLDRDRQGVLPSGPGGALDPWAARAVLGGDVLRDQAPAEARPRLRRPRVRPPWRPPPARAPRRSRSEAPSPRCRDSRRRAAGPAPRPRSTSAAASAAAYGGASRASTTGCMSQAGEMVGGASSVALDLLPSEGQSIRVSSRRSEIPSLRERRRPPGRPLGGLDRQPDQRLPRLRLRPAPVPPEPRAGVAPDGPVPPGGKRPRGRRPLPERARRGTLREGARRLSFGRHRGLRSRRPADPTARRASAASPAFGSSTPSSSRPGAPATTPPPREAWPPS